MLVSSTATGVALTHLSFTPIEAGIGTVEGSEDISIEDHDLVYRGEFVDAVDVTITNSGSSAHDLDVNAALVNASGDTLLSKTVSTSIGASTVKTLRDDFAEQDDPLATDVDDVQVSVEELGDQTDGFRSGVDLSRSTPRRPRRRGRQ